ncbi:Hypothetical protein D9617_6g094570 [Elsinoe fawcettii]|nr:Hypothetical protein D9617_6g094570 [Elsinoe fawcettii]
MEDNTYQEQLLQACAILSPKTVVDIMANQHDQDDLRLIITTAIDYSRSDLFYHVLTSRSIPLHDGYIALRRVITERLTSFVEILLELGWDINEDLGSYYGCALAWAISCPSPEGYIRWLLEHELTRTDQHAKWIGPDMH